MIQLGLLASPTPPGRQEEKGVLALIAASLGRARCSCLRPLREVRALHTARPSSPAAGVAESCADVTAVSGERAWKSPGVPEACLRSAVHVQLGCVVPLTCCVSSYDELCDVYVRRRSVRWLS